MSGLTIIDSIPNEILDAVFDALPTPALLPMTLVCRRFCAVATSALKIRLLRTAERAGLDMVLECYHPSARLSTPSLACRPDTVEPLCSGKTQDDWTLGDLGALYSRFRPEAGTAAQDVALDEGELFTQLCTSAAVVRRGPRVGLYRSHSGVGEGVVRVWRDWLAGRQSSKDDGILWADHHKNMGVRFSVSASAHGEHLPPMPTGEEPAVEYTLHYEEVLVRTSRVLLAAERSAAQEGAQRGSLVEVAGTRSFAVERVVWSAVSHPGYVRPGVAVA